MKNMFSKLQEDIGYHNVIVNIFDKKNLKVSIGKALISDGEILWSKCSEENKALLSSKAAEITNIRYTDWVEYDECTCFLEVLEPQPKLVVCGAGHVGIAVVKIAHILGMDITILEDRDDFAKLALEAGASRAIIKDFREGLDEIDGGEEVFFVCMTRAHAYDQRCLEKILPKESAYVGMLGSAKKINGIKANLEKVGIGDDLFEKVHTPIGLNIGAQTPEEIAVAVMGEIIQVKNERGNVNATISHELLDCIAGESDDAVLVTILGNDGPVPRKPGTKMLVYATDDKVGTVGGGSMEAIAIRKAVEMINDKTIADHVETLGTAADYDESGMACAGQADMLFERV